METDLKLDEKMQKIVSEIESVTPYLSGLYDDGEETNPKEFEDDNFIHIARGKYRFCFYNGQDEGAFKQKDVKKFAYIVDEVLKEQGSILTNMSKKSDVLKPSVSILCKLGSLYVHLEEGTSDKKHPMDVMAIKTIIDDPELKEWIIGMDKMAFLPKKR